LVHIKKVEIFGFKSFGFRNTVVSFERGLVSISGPNGSGKSNILDAIIFAMGENRPKVMRVDRLRSLIHDIEGQRRGPRLARVNVTFDNSDRKIPVDSDTVDIAREMSGDGENTYYLNKKQANRTRILDLLDVANAGLSQLNAVQQGTVTRISEFSSEEKRQTIEDLVGLSYFDEKKTEAIKQLDDADVRLEVALAKMGEIKKRIDELEEERNQKLRHDMLESEIRRLEAVSAAGRLREVRASESAKRDELLAVTDEAARLGAEHERIRQDIAKLESEKSGFMEKADAYNRAKAELDSELSRIVREYEQAGGALAASQRRISQIDGRIPEIEEALRHADQESAQAASGASGTQDELNRVRESQRDADSQLQELDGARAAILDRQSAAAKRRGETDSKIRSLTDRLGESRLSLSRIESEIQGAGKSRENAESARSGYGRQSAELAKLLARYESRISRHADTISTLKSKIDTYNARGARIRREIDELQAILEKSTRAAAQYETKIRVVRSIMHEDYTIAQLHEDGRRLGVEGLAYQLISWDARYERAVLAAGSDWIKAFVVRDMATLLALAEAARAKKLPKLRIIPLEAMPGSGAAAPAGPGVLGVLSDFVKTRPEHAGLGVFLFGNVILADSRDAAYGISLQGYRAVTISGELFEPKAGAVTVDINSRISKLTRIITLSSSVDGLLRSITLLKRHAGRRARALEGIDGAVSAARDRMGISERELASARQSHSDLQLSASGVSDRLAAAERRISEHSRRAASLEASAVREQSRIESIRAQIETVRRNYADGEQERIASELSRVNGQKSALESRRTKMLSEIGRLSSDLGAARAAMAGSEDRARGLGAELASIREERSGLESEARESERLKTAYGEQLVSLRGREQELIETSGASVSQIAGYDDRLGALRERDRGLARQIGALERRSDALGRDLADLEETGGRLTKVLDSSGFGEDTESFDVTQLLAGLRSEAGSLTALNAKAPEAYAEVSSGYRSMSARKNSLEEERNSIVRFIEEIERDKRQTFLDAFDRVDKEIRKIFAKMTGGHAWLELQNEDDIFSSGISYLIQFPNKPKRESTSISGGEKTLAAIVFVLALQRLKPSPFYLFDEVDAHLDAPNSERLARILEERAEESQFLMVSLKDSVVRRARLIYGVFPKNGVSNVVTYKDRRMANITG